MDRIVNSACGVSEEIEETYDSSRQARDRGGKDAVFFWNSVCSIVLLFFFLLVSNC